VQEEEKEKLKTEKRKKQRRGRRNFSVFKRSPAQLFSIILS
jgi:hypothetical protein